MPDERVTHDRGKLYASLVWILSAVTLIIYGITGLLSETIPGVEELVRFLSTADGTFIYIAAFLSIFIEGLYVVGSFFPGSTLVTILAILSQIGGGFGFVATIGMIFLGWTLAGVVNIVTAKTYRRNVVKRAHDPEYIIEDRIWTTWFPAFRANYEVAQITEGGNPFHVFISSVRVKLLACLGLLCLTAALPYFINIHEVSNEEGFASIAAVAAISFTVGVVKLRTFLKTKKPD